ncbi:hypothetical protein Hdeb2414_s0010g00340801 [Helianthus debilis subsp. tardiflorus]
MAVNCLKSSLRLLLGSLYAFKVTMVQEFSKIGSWFVFFKLDICFFPFHEVVMFFIVRFILAFAIFCHANIFVYICLP